jgi:hypothetical protein
MGESILQFGWETVKVNPELLCSIIGSKISILLVAPYKSLCGYTQRGVDAEVQER